LFDNLQKLFRYRALIQSLVARDLKARYRGSVLGFLWSFINPLFQLLIFTFVFTYVLPVSRGAGLEPYALFMLCGILPWTWFESSLLESSNVLIAGGNLIRKVLFPAEVLPIVTVLAGLVHFCLGLLVVAAFVLYYRRPITGADLMWLPVVILVQLVFTTGLALLVSALTVHFRDMRDLLMNVMKLWFYATPIVYSISLVPESARPVLNLNPFTHLAVSYQDVLFKGGPFAEWPRLLLVGAVAVATLFFGYFVFDRLRDTLAEEV
jgi:ABC-type polysaccharide/polyol phosphate export permease